jgi:hypothetical protein
LVNGGSDNPDKFADLGLCIGFRMEDSRLDPKPEFLVGEDRTVVIGLLRLTITDDSDPDPALSRDPLTDRRFVVVVVEEEEGSERTGDIICKKNNLLIIKTNITFWNSKETNKLKRPFHPSPLSFADSVKVEEANFAKTW